MSSKTRLTTFNTVFCVVVKFVVVTVVLEAGTTVTVIGGRSVFCHCYSGGRCHGCWAGYCGDCYHCCCGGHCHVSGLAITGIVVALLPRLLLVLLSELFVEAHVLFGLFQSLKELILLVSVCCVSRSWSLLVHDSSKGRTMFFHHLSQKMFRALGLWLFVWCSVIDN